MSLLGLDVGTTGTKAVAFDPDGRVIASSYREYPLLSPRPGWQELDPERVWSSVQAVLASVAAATKRDPVRSMAVSAQGEACHPVDGRGNCLANSVVTFDSRTAGYPAWWLERKSRLDIARITGMPLHGMHTINKIIWFRENRPDIYGKAEKFLCYEDFIHLKLGLQPVMSDSLAARTMAFDVRAGEWSDEMLGLAGIDRALLARTAPGGTPVGAIPDRVADDIGLPRGITVAAGGHDQPAAALGAGIMEAGEALLSLGTVAVMCPVSASFAVTPDLVDSNLCCYNSCVPGLYASLAFNFTGGSLLKWYRDTFGGLELYEAATSRRDVYDIILGAVPEGPEGLLVLPHFTVTGTPHYDTASRGVIAGLTLNTGRGEVVSAIISGICYEMKLNLELLKRNGVAIDRVRMAGGGAKSPVLAQRFADVLGVPVAVMANGEAAALGVALLGGSAAGAVGDLGEAALRMAPVGRVHEPDARRRESYRERFAIYRDLYPAMREISHRLAGLQS